MAVIFACNGGASMWLNPNLSISVFGHLKMSLAFSLSNMSSSVSILLLDLKALSIVIAETIKFRFVFGKVS